MSRLRKCSICGSEADVTHVDEKGHGTLYGASCGEGHEIGMVFGTRNRAVKAWNECQSFVAEYSGEMR